MSSKRVGGCREIKKCKKKGREQSKKKFCMAKEG